MGFLDLENLLSLLWLDDCLLNESFAANVAADSSLVLDICGSIFEAFSVPESSSLSVDWPLNFPLFGLELEIWNCRENSIKRGYTTACLIHFT